MKHFCIIANPYKDKGGRLSNQLKELIDRKGGSCRIIEEGAKIPESAEGIFVIGGDGTLIRAAGPASRRGIPLIGINLGHLGYLCELKESSAPDAVEEIMRGNYMIEERMMLGSGQVEQTALNDFVIFRKGALQIAELVVSVNGEYLNAYRADGVIVATPTGSTGYSMSAGGPIIDPKARMILITPINAHDLNSKSIVVGAEDAVTIELRGRQPHKKERAQVSVDGECAAELSPGDSITVRAAEQTARIIKLSKISFLEILRRKMQGY